MEKRCLSIKLPPKQNSGSILVGRGFLSDVSIKGKIIIVADLNLKSLAESFAKRWNALLITIPNQKTKSAYDELMLKLFQSGSDRNTTLVAFGGGVICDLVAFVAATFMRGIPLILIPTTLLAIVDASIGGKCAIDMPFGKNMIGSFYFPKMVFSDLDMLKTLPKAEWINGRAEILKMALIWDSSLWSLELDDDLICRAIKAKIDVVEQDPEERGLRRILNFGHTIGHGLEKIDETTPHGRSVALGSLAEAHLSMSLGFLSEKDFKTIMIPYQEFCLKLPSLYSRESLFEKMRYDKKKKDGSLRFCLIDKMGSALPFEGDYCYPVTEEQMRPTLDWLEKNYG